MQDQIAELRKQLTFVISAYEEERQKRYGREASEGTGMSSPEQHPAGEENEAVDKEARESLEKLFEQRKGFCNGESQTEHEECVDADVELSSAHADLEAQQRAAREANSILEEQVNTYKERLRTSERTLVEQGEDLQQAQVTLEKLEAEMASKLSVAEAKASEAYQQIEALKKANEESCAQLQEQRKTAEATKASQRGRITDLEAQLERAVEDTKASSLKLELLEGKVATAETQLKALKQELGQSRAAKAKACAADANLRQQLVEALGRSATLEEDLTLRTTELADVRKDLKDSCLAADKRVEALRLSFKTTQANLADKLRKSERLANEKAEALLSAEGLLGRRAKDVHDLEKRMLLLQRRHRKTLEEAMSSIVRLCVVAPTVNVHFDKTTEVYRAPLPIASVEDFIQREILPKFARVFRQQQEGKAPGGNLLRDWLSSLLSDMQGTIEGHLRKVFSKPDADTIRSTSDAVLRPPKGFLAESS
eukprot:scaffold8448_cov239-Pinguiococcus_pyrenoidosus.AAC.1